MAVRLPAGPIAVVRLPSGFEVSTVTSNPTVVDASDGRSSFTLAIPAADGPLAALLTHDNPPGGPFSEIHLGGRSYKVSRNGEEILILSKNPRVIISGRGLWTDKVVLELLRGLEIREERGGTQRAGQVQDLAEESPR